MKVHPGASSVCFMATELSCGPRLREVSACGSGEGSSGRLLSTSVESQKYLSQNNPYAKVYSDPLQIQAAE